MLKELYDRIQETALCQTLRIGSKEYTTERVHLVEDPIYKPDCFNVNTLQGIVSMIQTECEKLQERPLIINVDNFKRVEVHTTYSDRFERALLYRSTPDLPELYFERYMSHEKFMIELRSKFSRTEDVAYLLKLLASVVDENSVKSTDNGMTQKVEVKQGITTISEVAIKPIVSLKPYRTFLEVEQPESEFLVRLQEGGNIGLFEADGGMWKLQAKRNIANYFRKQLKDYIDQKLVVITE